MGKHLDPAPFSRFERFVQALLTALSSKPTGRRAEE